MISGTEACTLPFSIGSRETARGLPSIDIVFDTPSVDPSRDDAFATALQNFGKAILGGALEIVEQSGDKQERVIAPLKLFGSSRGWGHPGLQAGRCGLWSAPIVSGTSDIPSATWKAAEFLAQKPSGSSGIASRTVDKLLRTKRHLLIVNLAQALNPDGVPPNYFKDKIVMIGGRSQ
jgi:hypothetical protein